jgi:cysteine desulfurase/selenocysteine lyase
VDVRKDFPILKRKVNGRPLVYFDNAATTQKPVQVIESVSDFYKNRNANVGRGVHTLAREATEAYEEARRKVARFINAGPEEVIFTSGTTQGLNMVAQAYEVKLGKKNEVVTSMMEHHSSYLPIKMLSKKTGCSVRLVDLDKEGSLDIDSYARNVNKRTGMVSITHVSNVLGAINPVEELAAIAHENGAAFVLDAAQSVPHMPVDVKRLGCDFMAFSGHKMLGPMGIGVLYGRKELLEEMEPSLVGGGAVARTCPGEIEFLAPPQKFEAGTPNAAGAVGLAAAIGYLEGIGMEKVQKHERDLTKIAVEGMGELETYGPANRIGIVSFNVPGVNADDVAIAMDENGIAIRSGQHCAQPLMCRLKIDGCARMSFYIYNMKEEVNYAVGIIDKIKKLA